MAWQWDIERDHWMTVEVSDVGISYTGEDWTSLSGGAYMAGFQTWEELEAHGPRRGMPDHVLAAVLAERPRGDRHPVVVRIGGERPDEIHLEFAGQSVIRRGTDVVFEGDLAAGTWPASGVCLYPGVDAAGRRRMGTFSAEITVNGPTTVVIDEIGPRFPD